MHAFFPQRLRYGYPFLPSLSDKAFNAGITLFQPPLSPGQLLLLLLLLLSLHQVADAAPSGQSCRSLQQMVTAADGGGV